MGTVSIIFLVGAEGIISIFTQQQEVVQYAVRALRIISTGYIFYGFGMVMINAFNGAGDTWTPMLINVVGFWMVQIPLAYLLAKTFALGPYGVFIAIPVAEMIITVIAYILFRRGKWKLVKV